MGERITFAIFAGITLSAAIGVITLKNPFRAAVSLIGTLLGVAGLFLVAAAPFVAVIQVIVYASAIVVLFLFVIAFLGENPPDIGKDPLERWSFLSWFGVLVLSIVGYVGLANSDLPRIRAPFDEIGDIGSPEAVGQSFVDTHALVFEATSVLLLVAAIGAVVLARRAVLGERGR